MMLFKEKNQAKKPHKRTTKTKQQIEERKIIL
jgi:hypothetical protein